MTHILVAMEIERAGALEDFTHVPNSDCHSCKVCNCSFAEANCIECCKEFEEVEVDVMEFVECVFVLDVAPSVGKCLLLCFCAFVSLRSTSSNRTL